MRENLDAKAERFLTDKRVFVKWCMPEHVCAAVRGDSSVHDVHLHSGRWSCSSPSRVTCSHLKAVMLVTVPPIESPSNLPQRSTP